MSEDLTGTKLVGRYRSGAPLETTGNQSKDPGLAYPALLAAANINNFRYADPAGAVVPLAAHIRKGNPRDEATDQGGLADLSLIHI